MPIPFDPLNRWWMEVSGENPALADSLRPAFLAFLAFDPDLKPSIAGTGFLIAGDADFALAITAKHVLTEGVGRTQRPYLMHAPSALPEFVASGPPLTIDPQKLKLVWMGAHHTDMMNVGHVSYNNTLDAAMCVVIPQENQVSRFEPVAIPIDVAVPMPGELVHMISLDEMTLNESVSPNDRSGRGQVIQFTRRTSIRVGMVTGVYPAGYRQYRWPCFTTSIPAKPGMSGGFVFLPREDKTISACGVICADNSSEEVQSDFYRCGESVVASAWPLLALRVPDSIPSRPDTVTHSIYEMMRAGRMPEPIGGLDEVEIIEQENGDSTVRLRNTTNR